MTDISYVTVQIVAKADLIAQEIAEISEKLNGKRQLAAFNNALSSVDEIAKQACSLWQYKEDELTADVITQTMKQITATAKALYDILGYEFFKVRSNEQKAAVNRMLTATDDILDFAETQIMTEE